MRAIIIALFVLLIAVGCALPTGNRGVLYAKYMDYSENVGVENIEALAGAYFSGSLLEQGDLSDESERHQLLFRYQMKKIHSHHEKHNDKKGCLSVNGFDSDKEPIVFSLSYENISGNWLIDKIYIVFVDGVDGFASHPVCPGDASKELLGSYLYDLQ